jgi:hypothetical protein
VKDYEKHQLNRLLDPEHPGFRGKRKAIKENGTEEERELLAAWVKWEKDEKARNVRARRWKEITHVIYTLLVIAAIWAAVSALRFMWNHPLF